MERAHYSINRRAIVYSFLCFTFRLALERVATPTVNALCEDDDADDGDEYEDEED